MLQREVADLPSSRPVHDHRYPNQAEDTTQEIIPIWGDAVHTPSPKDGKDNEHTPIGSIDPPKVRWLVCRHNAIEKKHQCTDGSYTPVGAISPPQPDQIPTTDFAESRQRK
jgi:hypothetical protein